MAHDLSIVQASTLRQSRMRSVVTFAVFFLAVLGIVLLSGGKPRFFIDDARAYDLIAHSLLERGSLEFYEERAGEWSYASREPVFPMFLAGLYAIFGNSPYAVLFVQAALLAFFLVCLGLFLSRRLGAAAGLAAVAVLVATPGFALMAGQYQAEMLFTALLGFAVLSCAKAFEKKSASGFFVAGVLLSLAIGTRAVVFFLPVALAALGAFHLKRQGFSARRILGFLALFLFASYSVSAAWTARNYVRYGIFQPVSSSGGVVAAIHAEKVHLSGQDLRAYITSVFLGDYIAERIFPFYASRKVAIEQNRSVKELEGDLRRAGMADYDQDRFFREMTGKNFRARPFAYLAHNLLEIVKLNTPMRYDQASLRNLFSGSPSSLWKIAVSILVRVTMLTALFCVCCGLWVSFRRKEAALLILALPLIYANVVLSFFDLVPRFALPSYPYYAVFGAIGALTIFPALRRFLESSVYFPARTS